jgi:hypothetical protein
MVVEKMPSTSRHNRKRKVHKQNESGKRRKEQQVQLLLSH